MLPIPIGADRPRRLFPMINIMLIAANVVIYFISHQTTHMQEAQDVQAMATAFLAPGYSSEKLHVFLAEDLVPERLAQDADEHLEVETFTWEQVDELLRSGAFADSKTLAGLLLTQKLLKARQ